MPREASRPLGACRWDGCARAPRTRLLSRRQSGRTATHVGLFTGDKSQDSGGCTAYGAGWGCFLSRPRLDALTSHSLSPLTLASTQQPRSGRDESQCKGTIRWRRGEHVHARDADQERRGEHLHARERREPVQEPHRLGRRGEHLHARERREPVQEPHRLGRRGEHLHARERREPVQEPHRLRSSDRRRAVVSTCMQGRPSACNQRTCARPTGVASAA